MKEYDHKEVEAKWQKKWWDWDIDKVGQDPAKPKCYVLDMFPYPSGEGLHVGHPKGYIATDIYSRYQKMRGFNVLHPMGWDAFGLPAENYAIKNKVHPKVAVEKNIAYFKSQLKKIGFNYDWEREIDTTDPNYYKWTQWIFLKLWEKGLAYESWEPINWCPSCQTGLANEDLEDGKCERCGSVVEKKPMRQWMLKITDYAERLLLDLDQTDYVMPKIVDDKNPHEPGKPLVTRQVAHAIVFDPKTSKYLIIRNKKFGWDTVIIGGIEEGEEAVETARREVKEETGYTDLEFKRILGGPTEASYYAKHKGQNRVAIATAVYFELKSDARVPVGADEDEADEVIWVEESHFVPGTMVNSELPIWLERLKDPKAGWPKPLLNWPESIKESQRNWIGKSEGALIKFKLTSIDGQADGKHELEIFTTRPDTIFGVTFMAISPELAKKWLEVGWPASEEIKKFIEELLTWRATNNFKTDPEKKGLDTGICAINPANGEAVPVWITNYVLGDVGTGAVMSVPAHDERDKEFAEKYKLPISDAALVTKEEVVKKVNGAWTTRYKLKDWVFSRQRYWGEPIPIVHCEKCGVVPVAESDLPVLLPEVEHYEPTGTGESPLANITDWVNTTCPKCGGPGKRETNTMPQWAGSSWYYLRFIDPKNDQALVDKNKEKYWSPVDMYVGGTEHATRHLIYARFWHKVLFDLGYVTYPEPFTELKNQGLVLGEDGRKMSKRWGNVVNPDDVIELYGADTLRLYEMFMGPFEQGGVWSTNSMVGMRRFLERVWRLAGKVGDVGGLDLETEVLFNQTIKKVGEDIASFQFNTAISSLMILTNKLEELEQVPKNILETILILLAPFAPHTMDELWSNLDHSESIHLATWPQFDETKLISDQVTISVQVDGKTRGTILVKRGTSEEGVLNQVKNETSLSVWLVKGIERIIYIPDRLINIIIRPHAWRWNE